MRSLALTAATATVLGLVLIFATAQQSAPTTAVALVQLAEGNWNQFAPEGKEVDAIYGDYVLRNAHLTAVIAQPLATRNANMTVRDVAGALIDLTATGAQSDQLSAFYPGKKNFAYRAAELSAAPAGGQLAPVATLPATGLQAGAAAVAVTAAAAEGKPEVRTVYRLGAGDAWLTVETTFRNPGQQPLTVSLEDDFRADGGKEDMVRSPNGAADRFWLHDRFWGQAYGLEALGRQLQITSDARVSQLKYVDAAGDAKVALPPGAAFTLTRRLYPGRNVLEVHALHEQLQQRRTTSVRLTARDDRGRPIPHARVEVRRGEDSLGVAVADEQGVVAFPLAAGQYALRWTRFGQSLGADRPLEVPASGVVEQSLTLAGHRFGTVEAAITDAAGRPIPCKVAFRPQADGVKLDFGPETAEFAVRNLRYTPNGKFTQALPPGRYDVTISHGPEFDAVFTELTVPAYDAVALKAQLVRSVDTTGWVSSDFHSHSSPSGDNTGSQLGRVLNLVCEHIEFAPCTEHNRVSTYQPHIDRLGIGQFISSVSGIELTGSPLPLNHQNVFPMQHAPRTQDGGGPTTAAGLEEQIERLALWDDRSEKLLQVNHPDIGWMFYDKDGDGKPDAGHERAFPFMDVMEIHPVENALDLSPFVTFRNGQKFHNTVFRWLQLLNQGFRIYGVVNTDAHYNFHGSGNLRNWIQSPTDEPAQLKYMDMVHAAEQGRLVMSNGPFLEVWAQEAGRPQKVTAGQDLPAPSKKVALQVRVQSPNWIDIDRLFVLVNGRIHREHNYFRNQHPDAFRSGAVKFDRTLELTLAGDSHLIVVTGDIGGDLSRIYDTEGKMAPAALSNPIFVDVDGNGFQANKDTLDAALPVKFGAGGT